jgi:hypothetical protein
METGENGGKSRRIASQKHKSETLAKRIEQRLEKRMDNETKENKQRNRSPFPYDFLIRL